MPKMAGGGSSSAASSGESSPSRRSGRPDLPLVSCPYCQAMLVERTSKTPENYLKKFYRCLTITQDGSQCKFFQWQGEYAVWLLESGYLRVASEEDMKLKALVADVVGALRMMNGTMTEMTAEAKALIEPMRMAVATSTAKVNENARIVDKLVTIGSVFVGVLVVFIAIILTKK
ncbi:hypothetical protein ACP70R_036899 [Stipagrostis hirtigluma subsp. patula]